MYVCIYVYVYRSILWIKLSVIYTYTYELTMGE